MQKVMRDLYPSGKSQHFRITKERCISIPSEAMERLGWTYDDQIASRVVLNPLTLLLWRAPADRPGYKLHANGRSGSKKLGASKLSMSAFINRYVDGSIFDIEHDAPIDIIPAYIQYPEPYQVALILETSPWSEEILFLPNVLKKISDDAVGVYRFLSTHGSVIKYGKGRIQNRLLVQYEEKEKRDFVHRIQYFCCASELAPIFERIFIELHIAEFSDLPLFNKIKA
jgi:hypothetical protein